MQVNGRVSSLIELGAGFHPDMSGRENIYLNAAIFGLKRKEINDRIDKIIAFSELSKFIDNPIRTYSSGMYMRLAFAVAINVSADVLLIDEILAVGDINYQRKCFEKLKEIKNNGTTIVIVSHSLGQIEEFCDRSLWIENGRLRMTGRPQIVHPKYIEFMQQKQSSELELLAEQSKTLARIKGRLDTNDLKVDISPIDLKPINLSTKDFKIRLTNQTKQILSPDADFPIVLSYHVYDSRGKIVIEEGTRTPLFKRLLPGESAEGFVHFDLSQLSSENTNEYSIRITLVQESQFWFDAYCSKSTLSIPFTVMNNSRLDTNDLLVKIERTVDSPIDRDTHSVDLLLTNMSSQSLATASPYPVFLTYRVIDQYGNEVIAQGLYTRLPSILLPNAQIAVKLKTDLQKLEYAGNYTLFITLLQENQFWFDTYNPASVLELHFSLTGRLVPNDLDITIRRLDEDHINKDTLNIPLNILNNTHQTFKTEAPYPVYLSYHITTDAGQEVIFDGLRTPLEQPFSPGESRNIDLKIDLTKLRQDKQYVIQVSFVQESQFWFESFNKNILLKIPVE